MRKSIFFIFYAIAILFLGGGNLIAMTMGDVSGDGYVDINDALWVAYRAAGFKVSSNFNEPTADVDGNGSVTIVDALLIAKYSAGLIVEFPAQPYHHNLEPQFMVIEVPIIDETILQE